MSLSSIIGAAGSALTASQVRIATANANVANADDLTYTRKTVTSTPTTATVSVSNTTVQRAADAFLSKTVLSTAASAGYDSTVDSFMQSYDSALGSTTGGDDISSLLTRFQTALSTLDSSTGADTAKAGVVSAASTLASAVRGLSGEVQTLRGQANTQIETTVGTVNQSLKTLASLNDQIATTTAQGGDATGLEDQRDAALSTLSGLVGVSSYVTTDNQLRVYTTGGDALLGTTAATLSYTASSQLGAGSTYPGAIAGITLNGKDVTTSLGSGTLGALVTLRDTTLPAEQDKLDALTSTLITQVNAVANAGSSVPAPNSLTSASTVNASDALSATGTLRVAVVDSSGGAVATQDLDLSTYSTVGDLVTALNGIGGLSASIGADGKLSITASSSANGVALADDGAGISAKFGFNNLFTGADASDIGVSASLASDASGLPTATLSTTGTLAVGDRALTSGDSTVATALGKLLDTALTIPAAGGQAAKTVSLSSYAASFVSGAATLIANAASQSATSTAVSDAATSRLQNLTAVNVDEELANLTQYQSQYEANAQMIAMAKTLFQALVTMLN